MDNIFKKREKLNNYRQMFEEEQQKFFIERKNYFNKKKQASLEIKEKYNNEANESCLKLAQRLEHHQEIVFYF